MAKTKNPDNQPVRPKPPVPDRDDNPRWVEVKRSLPEKITWQEPKTTREREK